MGWRWRQAASSFVLAVLVLTPAARALCAMACAHPGAGPVPAAVVAAVAHAGSHAGAHHAHHAHQAPPARPSDDRSCAPAPLRPCDPEAAAALKATFAAARTVLDTPFSASAVTPFAATADARGDRAAIPRHRAGPDTGPPRAPLPLRI